MSISPVQTLKRAAVLALITGVWSWAAAALHGIWTFGIDHGYLDGGFIPLYPSQTVTYGSFFIDSASALLNSSMLAFGLCVVLPRKRHLVSICAAFVIGSLIGLSGIAYVYQPDFGTTFAPLEAVWALMVEPIATSIWLIAGLGGTVFLTAPFRR